MEDRPPRSRFVSSPERGMKNCWKFWQRSLSAPPTPGLFALQTTLNKGGLILEWPAKKNFQPPHVHLRIRALSSLFLSFSLFSSLSLSHFFSVLLSCQSATRTNCITRRGDIRFSLSPSLSLVGRRIHAVHRITWR